jgi:hypothetical protein
MPAEAGLRDASPRRDARNRVDGAAPGDANGGCVSGSPGVQCVASVEGDFEIGGPIAVDDSNVYWAEVGQVDTQDFVMQTPRRGGASVTIAIAQGSPRSLVTDGVNVYWNERPGGPGGPGGIFSVPVGGGSVTTVASSILPLCIAIDDTSVYWSDYDYTIGVVPKGGGTTSSLTVNGDMSAYALAVDATHVYWSADGVHRADKDGQNQVTLFPGPMESDFDEGCGAFTLTGDTLFFAYYAGDGSIPLSSVNVSGQTSAKMLATNLDQPSIAAGSGRLFWFGLASAIDVEEMPVGGGPTRTLAAPVTNEVGDLAVASDGTLYWTTDLEVQSLVP